MLLLMSLFSIYCGLLYNDFFGQMLDLFGSAWKKEEGAGPTDSLVRTGAGDTYAFGLDPGWHHSQNELTFANSYKMKLSIIVGVLQMLLGLMCSLLNALHFRDELTVWCEFVPQVPPAPAAEPPPRPHTPHASITTPIRRSSSSCSRSSATSSSASSTSGASTGSPTARWRRR